MSTDVASFGDYFADQSLQRGQTLVETVPRTVQIAVEDDASAGAASPSVQPDTRNGKKIKLAPAREEEEIKSLVFRDPIAGTYKKYLFSKDVRPPVAPPSPPLVKPELTRSLHAPPPLGQVPARRHDGRRLLRFCQGASSRFEFSFESQGTRS